MRVDLNLLRLLLTIYDTGSVTAAAEHLKMSQPTASAALARLRHSFGDPLFVRHNGVMSPTPRAQNLIDKTREVIALIDSEILRSPDFVPETADDEFVFCLSAIGEIVFLPTLFDFISKAAPHTRIRSISLPPSRLEEALVSGEVDLLLGYYPDIKESDIFQQRLFSHELTCMVRSGHAIEGERMTLQQFVDAEHALVKDGGRSQEMFEAELQARRIERKIVLRTSHYMSIPTIIARSDLVVVLPKPVANAFAGEKNVRVIDAPVEIPKYDLKMYWHRRFHKDPKSVWLRAAVLELFAADAAQA
ncbi:LysR family transcriptional regulator [Herbaspirillum robiniae]|uniref:LysR family transcriptional regulator n=1 Tax=Herbaspirillum robiniae TaxID=2014887 RepID=A0ABX2M261_9BURK|nr:LysR family transcriptional regulator [Herbaspirillum robiniae]NUU04058.1 LysR family transcriptional regulator [Herbaspirillum robiniae]